MQPTFEQLHVFLTIQFLNWFYSWVYSHNNIPDISLCFAMVLFYLLVSYEMMTTITVNDINLSMQLIKETWKNSGLKETWTHDLCDTDSAIPVQR